MIAATTSASTIGSIPIFLLGAMGPLVRADLAFSEAQLGVAVSMFWLFMAAFGVHGGRFGQRLGATLATRIGVSISLVAIVAMALATNWPTLVVLMAVAGMANALCQPALDLALFEAVDRDRLSLAFGIKQTALPGAALVAGLVIPLLASNVGWRWAFVACASVGLPALIAMPTLSPGHRSNPTAVSTARQPLQGVVAFAAVFTLAMIAVSATGAFYVESAVNGGSSVDTAGLYLAVGSLFGIVGRFLFAWRLGKLSKPLLATAMIMSLGGIGVMGLAIVGPGLPLLAVTVVAIGAGWGWNGLLTFAVVSAYPQAPARASGFVVLGAGAGGVLGPLLFGFAVQHVGFPPAWLAAGACFFAAAFLVSVLGQRRASEAPAAG